MALVLPPVSLFPRRCSSAQSLGRETAGSIQRAAAVVKNQNPFPLVPQLGQASQFDSQACWDFNVLPLLHLIFPFSYSPTQESNHQATISATSLLVQFAKRRANTQRGCEFNQHFQTQPLIWKKLFLGEP
ncbi:Serine/threonine-protein kinase DCLK1 [Platysternon megacephalum]|uniref:Serine/threonine-protein kinase DCLK1 n=1 Tax=Platysternon megacephalum TaxID=55544 RepID=A0A4D9EL72_9SAUR|nr:Serine/threonine-protein kinase DCLK1 [Platysternon megacephalum]